MRKNEFIITLLKLPRIGKVTARKICSEIYDPELSLHDLEVYFNSNKRSDITVRDIESAKLHADEVIRTCDDNSIKIVNYSDNDFPKKLLDLKNPPVILYYKGEIGRLNQKPSIAIIGTREPSNYGVEIAKKYTEFFVKKDFNIISGLAKGIDGIGHEVTIKVDGFAAAFIAQGLNTPIYPSENQKLANSILDKLGVLISEYEPNVKPNRNYFVERDRLQSGSSDAVLVIETSTDGGSLHAANSAIELNRLCAVLDHPDKYKANNSKSRGNEMLIIEKGAIPLFSKESLEDFSTRIVNRHELFVQNANMETTVSTNEKPKNAKKVKQISLDV